jgi:hemerythrin-like domain-containing protein
MESLSQFLEQDHIHCDALFRLVSDSVCLRRWPQAKREIEAQDIPAFYNHADAFLLVMHQHSEKEEGVLYPRIERVLAHSCHDLVKAMRAFGVHDDSEDAA